MSFFRRVIFGTSRKKAEDKVGVAGSKLSAAAPYSPDEVRIWAIGGGKGGVGKSLVSSSLGILLANRTGKRVLLVDADIGAANLHTFLGVENPKATLSNFLKYDSETDIRPYVSWTGLRNIDLVSGAKDSLTVVDFAPTSIPRLRDALSRTDYGYIIMDIGPGTSANNLDLFLAADEGVLVTTPEPTSIENTYRFLKCLFLRRIRNICSSSVDSRLKDIINMVLAGHRDGRIKTVSDIMLRLKELDAGKGRMLAELMGNAGISLVVNQAKRASDGDIGPSMKRACRDYFGIDVSYIGEVSHDEAVEDSIRGRKPLVISHGNSSASRSLSSCLEKLLGKEKTKAEGTFLINF